MTQQSSATDKPVDTAPDRQGTQEQGTQDLDTQDLHDPQDHFHAVHNQQLMSFASLRLVVGVMALLMPVLFILADTIQHGTLWVQKNISYYYYTNRGTMLVGMFFVFALYLFAYQGHPAKQRGVLSDGFIATLGGAGLIGLALFPTSIHITDCPSVPIGPGVPYAGCPSPFSPLVHQLHFYSALVVFVVLAYLCVFAFPHDHAGTTHQKIRQIISRACGGIIILNIIGIAAVMWAPGLEEWMKQFVWPLMLFESMVISAFGVALLASSTGKTTGKATGKDTGKNTS